MRIVGIGLALLLTGCATAPSCPAGMMGATTLELFFGRNAGAAERVGDAAWDEFLAREVTPRFPDGLTVLDAVGQWRGRDGRVSRERSKVLVIALPGIGAEEAAARAGPVAEAYRARFAQESVLRSVRAGCVGF